MGCQGTAAHGQRPWAGAFNPRIAGSVHYLAHETGFGKLLFVDFLILKN